ncbi:MAG: flagellar basal body L-ring protein FlgH [Bryobacteraceae bacterium]|nr:flagellar basal body L-ring protein FlgH [Bryobacteraceae bacterium]
MPIFLLVLVLLPASIFAREKKKPEVVLSPLDRFLSQSGATAPIPVAPTAGSLYSPSASMLDLTGDLRAHRANDIVTVIVFDRASAVAKGSTKTARTSSANASITGLAGTPPAADRLANLIKLGGNSSLDGQGETTREVTLNTTITARVTHVLPNGLVAIEGFKSVRVNSENQQISLRGLVRIVDLSPTNRIASDSIAMLEIVVDGKGVVGDAVRRPNFLYRLLLGLLPF